MTVSSSRGSLVTYEGRSIVAPVLDAVVAGLADDQRLTPAGGHDLCPFGFFCTALALQVGQAADVMYFDVFGCSAQLTFLGQQPFHHFATFAPDGFHPIANRYPF